MSHFSSIDINHPTETSAINILNTLKNFGWTLNIQGFINILPINDNGLFNWTRLKIDEENLAEEIINQKQTLGELVGFSLVWKDTGIGGDFLLQNGKIIFLATIHRQLLYDGGYFTDISWYLSKLIPPISSLLTIENIVCEEYV